MARTVTYTYDDFTNAVAANGLSLDQFSDADLKLAQSSPEAGMSLVSYKRDYLDATTDEARYLANEGANQVRSQYGGYTANENGLGYYSTGLSPADYSSSQEAPTYAGTYADDAQSAYDDVKNYGDFEYTPYDGSQYKSVADENLAKMNDYGEFSYDPYVSQYADKKNQLLDDITGYGDFSYDASTDENYAAARKQYLREGQRAMQDTLGTVAASTGGTPSSYAVTAASQANDYYATQLADKYSEYYNQAYQEYLNGFDMARAKYSEVSGADDTEYNRYVNDRTLDYDIYNNRYNQYAQNASTADALNSSAYNQWYNNTALDKSIYDSAYDRKVTNLDAARGMESDEYNRYLSDTDVYNNNRDFEYGQMTDEIGYQTDAKNTATSNAYAKWEVLGVADDEIAGVLGVPVGSAYGGEAAEVALEQDKAILKGTQLDNALAGVQYGDFSGLEAAGIEAAPYQAAYTKAQSDADYATKFDQALSLAENGSFGALAAMGFDVSGMQSAFNAELNHTNASAANVGSSTRLSEQKYNDQLADDAEAQALLKKAQDGTATADDYARLMVLGYDLGGAGAASTEVTKVQGEAAVWLFEAGDRSESTYDTIMNYYGYTSKEQVDAVFGTAGNTETAAVHSGTAQWREDYNDTLTALENNREVEQKVGVPLTEEKLDKLVEAGYVSIVSGNDGKYTIVWNS